MGQIMATKNSKSTGRKKKNELKNIKLMEIFIIGSNWLKF